MRGVRRAATETYQVEKWIGEEASTAQQRRVPLSSAVS